jgi:outer membrane protein TolC
MKFKSPGLKSFLPALLVTWIHFPAIAQQNTPAALPEPLTLEYALTLVEVAHPDVISARSALNQARAKYHGVRSETAVQTSIQGFSRWVDPPNISVSQENQDHHLGLFVSKRLYDFGRGKAREAAADALIKSEEIRLANRLEQRRIEIVQAYFNVMLADLEYIRDNEEMATAFVSFDRVRDRNKLGQVSDIELLKAQSKYQKSRTIRYASDVKRRAKRSLLAQLLNRPGMLPSNLANPKLFYQKTKLPDVDKLQERALKENPLIRALEAEVAAAKQRVNEARSENKPVINGELEASYYSREMGSRDRYRAGISFRIPLSTGGATQARIAERLAELEQARAKLTQMKMEVQQAVLDLWQRIYTLKARIDEMKALTEYRDLYLDRSRGLYELDVKTDLGDAMVQFSDARLKFAQARYNLELAWIQLKVLTGDPVYPVQAAMQKKASVKPKK